MILRPESGYMVSKAKQLMRSSNRETGYKQKGERRGKDNTNKSKNKVEPCGTSYRVKIIKSLSVKETEKGKLII